MDLTSDSNKMYVCMYLCIMSNLQVKFLIKSTWTSFLYKYLELVSGMYKIIKTSHNDCWHWPPKLSLYLINRSVWYLLYWLQNWSLWIDADSRVTRNQLQVRRWRHHTARIRKLVKEKMLRRTVQRVTLMKLLPVLPQLQVYVPAYIHVGLILVDSLHE